MKIPVGFSELCQGLYQDAAIAVGNLDELATDCLEFVSASNRPELRDFLILCLRTRTAAELKGEISRQKPDLRFSSSGAKAFLEAASRLLA